MSIERFGLSGNEVERTSIFRSPELKAYLQGHS
jgi:hypothetical protein